MPRRPPEEVARLVTGRRRKGNGPLPKPIDWDFVKKLCGIQCTIREIASMCDVNVATLYKACDEVFGVRCGEKFEEWRQAGNCSLRRSQWELAKSNASMAIFLGKQYLNQTDNYDVNHKGESKVQVVHYGKGEPKQWKGENEASQAEDEGVSERSDNDS